MTEACPRLSRRRSPLLADHSALHRRASPGGLAWRYALLLATLAAPGAWARPTTAKPAALVTTDAPVAAPTAAGSSAGSPAASGTPASVGAATSAGSAASAAAATGTQVPAAAARFGFYGLSPAQAGQALAQAETALGQALTIEAAAKPAKAAAGATLQAECHYRSTARQPGVRYALAGDLITRIETRDARYATFSGVHVGDSLARAQQAYGKRLTSTPHPYFDQGRMLTVYSPDRRFALVMETNDAGRIITLRGGRLPEVGWLEGCS